jgi:uncharacterized membrane protein YfcA
MITEPLFFLCATVAVLIAGIGKGGFGGGTVVVAVPLLSLVVPPAQAAAIMLPILCLMDLLSLWACRGVYDCRNLKVLLPAGLIGVGLGSLGFNVLPDVHIKLMIGFLAILFSINYWLMKWLPRSQASYSGSLLYGGIWGILSGFTSFSVHAGGPPLNIYLLPQKLHKTVFLGTIVTFFAVVNYVKLVSKPGLDYWIPATY